MVVKCSRGKFILEAKKVWLCEVHIRVYQSAIPVQPQSLESETFGSPDQLRFGLRGSVVDVEWGGSIQQDCDLPLGGAYADKILNSDMSPINNSYYEDVNVCKVQPINKVGSVGFSDPI